MTAIVAIEVGVVLAVVLVMRRLVLAAITGIASADVASNEQDAADVAAVMRTAPRGVSVYEINGPFFFGALYAFKQAIDSIAAERLRALSSPSGSPLCRTVRRPPADSCHTASATCGTALCCSRT